MLPDLIGDTGVVAALEPESLAAAWLQLIQNPQKREALGNAARSRAIEHFNPQKSAAAVEAFYLKLLSQRR